jgi:hypothetical protein
MAKPSASEEQIRAVLSQAEEEASAAFAELAQAVLSDSSKGRSLACAFIVRLFDVFAERYQAFTPNEEQLRSFYLPTLDRLSKKLAAKTEQWMNRNPRLWPKKSREPFLSTVAILLLGRAHHWKADTMKHLREARTEEAIPSNRKVDAPTVNVQVQFSERRYRLLGGPTDQRQREMLYSEFRHLAREVQAMEERAFQHPSDAIDDWLDRLRAVFPTIEDELIASKELVHLSKVNALETRKKEQAAELGRLAARFEDLHARYPGETFRAVPLRHDSAEPSAEAMAQAVQQRDKEVEDAIRLFESHTDFPRVQVRMRERMKEAARNSSSDARGFGTKPRLHYVLGLFKIRAESFLKLVSDIPKQNAFMGIVDYWERLAWEEYTGWPIEVLRPASAQADADLAAIHTCAQEWILKGYKRLESGRKPQHGSEPAPKPGNQTISVPTATIDPGSDANRPAVALDPTLAVHPKAEQIVAAVPAEDRHLGLLKSVLEKRTITLEKWAREQHLGRTSVFDWKRLRLSGKSLTGKVSEPKAAEIEKAIKADAEALGLTTRTDSD